MQREEVHIFTLHYASTSLSCAGIQWWQSVSFCCWAAINLVGEMSNEEQDTPLPYPPFSFLTVKSSASFLALGGKSLKRDCTWKNIELHSWPYRINRNMADTSRYFYICYLYNVYERKNWTFSTCFKWMSQMSDNMCISCSSAAVLAYWDPGGLAS